MYVLGGISYEVNLLKPTHNIIFQNTIAFDDCIKLKNVELTKYYEIEDIYDFTFNLPTDSGLSLKTEAPTEEGIYNFTIFHKVISWEKIC